MRMIFADALDLARPALGKKLLQLNWPFLLLITAITGIGVAALYSVAGGSLDPWASRHVVRYCIGLGILFALALIDIKWLMRLAYPTYLVALLLLVAVLLWGVESGGARR